MREKRRDCFAITYKTTKYHFDKNKTILRSVRAQHTDSLRPELETRPGYKVGHVHQIMIIYATLTLFREFIDPNRIIPKMSRSRVIAILYLSRIRS